MKTAPPGTQFTPLKDFFSKELGSVYVGGLSYTVRAVDAKLAALVPEWLAAHKIRLGGSASTINGKGGT